MATLALGISGRLEEGESLQAWVLGPVTGLQWQALINGSWVNVGPANSQAYTVPAGAAGTAYRLAGSSADGTFYSEPTGAAVVDTRKSTAPVFTGETLGTLATEGSGAISLFHWLTFSDGDRGNYGGGSLILQSNNSLLRGGDGEDLISIRFSGTQAGQFSYNAATREVRYAFTNGNAVTVGTIDAVMDGNGTDLKVTFNTAATAAVVDALTDNLQFRNDDDSPAAARLFTLRVTDPSGASAQRVTSVSIENTPDAPLFTSGANAVVDENQADVPSVAAIDPDREAGEPQGMAYSLAAGSGGTDNARFEIDAATGALRFIAAPDYEDAQHGPAYSVRVRATDSGGSTADQVITVTVRDVNEAPVASDQAVAAQEDGPATRFDVSYGDPDAGDSAILTFDTTGTAGTVSLDGRTFTYSAAGRFEQLPAYMSANDTFTYTVTDAGGLSTTRTVTVVVQGGNDAAAISGDASGSVQEDSGVDFMGEVSTSGRLSVSDVDQDEERFHVALSTGSANLGTFFMSNDGSWTYGVDNGRIQSLGAGQSVTDTYTVRSFDGSATQQLQVTISGVNDAPVVDAGGDVAGMVREPEPGTGVLAIDMGSTYEYPIIREDAAGRLLVLGQRQDAQGYSTTVLERHHADGSFDATFGAGGSAGFGFGFTPKALAIDGSGRAVAVGYTADNYTPNALDWAIARFNADGSPDMGFGNGGSLTLDFGHGYDQPGSVLLDGSGRIVVVGSTGAGAMAARFLQDGSLDTSFGDAGLLSLGEGAGDSADARLDGQGRLLLWGSALDPVTGEPSLCVVRLLADGSADASFGADGRAYVALPGEPAGPVELAVAPDGSLLVGWAEFAGSWTDYPAKLLRLTEAGLIDSSFGSDGLVDAGLSGEGELMLAIDGQGRVLVASDDRAGNVQVSRFGSDGSADLGFGNGGVASADFGQDDWLAGIQLLADGGILLTGTTWGPSGGDGAAARFDADGHLDTRFGDAPQGVVAATGQLQGSDADQRDTLQWSGSSAGTYGTFEITAAGAWTYVLESESAALGTLSEGQAATERFTATLTDGSGATATQEVVITVVGSYDPPNPA